ncbi:MAG: hypothetical protein ACRECH_16460, partial [Nitrososphaerales archaeon]
SWTVTYPYLGATYGAINYYQNPADFKTGSQGFGCGITFYLQSDYASMPSASYVHYYTSANMMLGACPYICFHVGTDYFTTNAYNNGKAAMSVS